MGKIIHFAVVVMIATAAATALLAGLNFATLSRIAEMDRKTQAEARKIALAEAVTFDEGKTIEVNVNNKNILSGVVKYIPGFDSAGNIAGYVATVNSPGYGARGVVYVIGIGIDGRIKGLKVTDASGETPGLGSNITKESWQNHWSGKDKTYQFDKTTDGFAGATISPHGVYVGIQEALLGFEKIKGGASNGQK